MSFTVDSVQMADVSQRTIWVQKILGAFELCFAFDVTVKRYGDQSRWANILGARVGLGRTTAETELGVASCVQPKFITQTNPGLRESFELRLTLAPHQLNALEEARNGGDLDFELSFIFEAGNKPGSRNDANQPNKLHARISRSDWIERLNSSGATNILLLEVPMPIKIGVGETDDIGRSMRRAREHFMSARYDDCVGECRKILEQLPNVSKKDVMDLLKTGRSGMTKEERDQSILFTLRNYCNPPHHSGARGGSLDYVRPDAKLILLMTASYVEHRAALANSNAL
jgi:hypothetical protein